MGRERHESEGDVAMRHFSVRAAVVAVTVLGAASLAVPAGASSVHSSGARFSAIPGSLAPSTDVSTGAFHSASMTVEVVLAPSHATQLQGLLRSLYNTHSSSYEHWLKAGQFDARFAPSLSETSAVVRYLTAGGLVVRASSSPFLVRATGSSARVATAFRTSLRMYRDPQGKSYYSNASAVRLPSSFAAGVLGVVGLTNTVRMHSMIQRAPSHATAATKRSTSHSHSTPSCETPYVTAAELFTYVNSAGKDGFPYGYGGGPGCSGLTPSQTNSIYDAPNVGPRGEGAGVNLGVFELSAYQHSDIDTWAHNFYGPGYNPRLVDITVDGGPLDPVCPMGDTCPPDYNGYAGDIEVDADIETQLALSPDNSHILVYNAPNDYTGQTELDEYTAIANQDRADVVSSSWSVCENDVTAGYVEAENEVFEQMALQGQSMFGAEGDTGAFECLRSDGTTIVNVLDPPAQPWVTSVGGTSLPVNPGTNPHPSYPNGAETVWNVDNLCNNGAPSAANDDLGGLFWCDETGAGGGGSSQYWGRPFYQVGPGINNPYTTHGNGTTQCALARTGTPCREVPDISANADEYTPYAEYCTANAGTPFSACGFSASEPVAGWFGIGGTSLSSPLWSAIIADRDSFQGRRSGNVNPLLYLLYNIAPHQYFHDITGIGQTTNNNGLFPTTPGYDLATGIGTPIMAAIITRSF
ncbi:MAG: S53 family peptidase [Acidimicrobiales bacterium]